MQKFSYSNVTPLLLACKYNYEKLNKLYQEDKVADSILLDYLKVDTEEYTQQ